MYQLVGLVTEWRASGDCTPSIRLVTNVVPRAVGEMAREGECAGYDTSGLVDKRRHFDQGTTWKHETTRRHYQKS